MAASDATEGSTATAGATAPRTRRARTKKSPWELVKATFDDWLDDDALRLGASLAFYTVWSNRPALRRGHLRGQPGLRTRGRAGPGDR